MIDIARANTRMRGVDLRIFETRNIFDMEQNMSLAIDEKKYYATVRILPGDRGAVPFSMHAIDYALPLHLALTQN